MSTTSPSPKVRKTARALRGVKRAAGSAFPRKPVSFGAHAETAASSPARSPGRPAEPKKPHVSAYLPPKVREQLDFLSVNERKPTGARKPLNDFILEGWICCSPSAACRPSTS